MTDKLLSRVQISAIAGCAAVDASKVDAPGLGFSDIGDLTGCDKLQRLNLAGNLLSSLTALAVLPVLSWLNVSHNALPTLNGIQKLRCLQVLNASHNTIRRTTHVAPLKDLKALILSNNDIERVEGLENLSSLGALVLSHNKIEELNLGGLCKLCKLSLSHNRIRAVPDLRGCYQLKELRLNDNLIDDAQLAVLPSVLHSLARVTLLDIGNNPVTELVTLQGIASALTSLVNLNIKGTPLAEDPINLDFVLDMFPQLQYFNGQPTLKRNGQTQAAAAKTATKALKTKRRAGVAGSPPAGATTESAPRGQSVGEPGPMSPATATVRAGSNRVGTKEALALARPRSHAAKAPPTMLTIAEDEGRAAQRAARKRKASVVEAAPRAGKKQNMPGEATPAVVEPVVASSVALGPTVHRDAASADPLFAPVTTSKSAIKRATQRDAHAVASASIVAPEAAVVYVAAPSAGLSRGTAQHAATHVRKRVNPADILMDLTPTLAAW